MLLAETEVELIKTTKGGNLYGRGEDIFLLKPCDRAYPNKKKPAYFIERIRDNKAKYITGLFPTETARVFSGDEKDPLGFKIIWVFSFSDDGKKIKIYKK